MSITPDPDALASFWQTVRSQLEAAPIEVPEAWAFGATREHADSLLTLVLAGTKTATASSVWDYEAVDEPFPEVGAYSVILDGSGAPKAVIRTVALTVVPFDDVDDEHAFAEGESDRTLASWRDIHQRFWTAHSENPRGFAPDMPVLCERFELVFPPMSVA